MFDKFPFVLAPGLLPLVLPRWSPLLTPTVVEYGTRPIDLYSEERYFCTFTKTNRGRRATTEVFIQFLVCLFPGARTEIHCGTWGGR